MDFRETLSARRDGLTNTPEQLESLALGAADGSIPDYQLSAWLMAAYLNPLSAQETADLTMAIAESGERLDLTGLPKPWVDKHSTGGVGDKTTIVLLPLLAACGLTVVKMSGRGLGITGGTVDKLLSVPGFRMDLTPEEMKAQASRIGLAITGQTPRLAPADKKLYALRDVTGTVGSVPLIVSSILSKKLAGGCETVVLDVKCGSGAFMKTLEQASELASWLKQIGQLCGLNLHLSITDMEQPLGRAVGNALEVKEAIRVLRGEAGRLRDLCVHFAGMALSAVGRGGAEDAKLALENGSALAKAREWFFAQGADSAAFESEDWCRSTTLHEVQAVRDGWVSRVDARTIGQVVVDMGGGRKRKDDEIDPSAGVVLHVEVGDRVSKGDLLAEIHGPETDVRPAFEIVEHEVERRPVVLA